MNKEILRLAIPNIISNISVPLISTVDTALMGRVSALHIGAVGLGSMIFNFLYWNFGFLRMGTTGFTAQAFGRKDQSEVINTLGRSFVIVFSLSVALLLFQLPLGEAAFYLMNTSDNQLPLVQQYFYIRIWAAPATLGIYALNGWFFGMQNAVFPLILTLIVNAVNIGLNFLFVVQWGMGIEGVAWSTVAAQYLGLLGGVILLFSKYGDLFKYLQQALITQWKYLKDFLRINLDIFIRTFFLTLAYSFFYSRSALSGDLILAVNVILLQFTSWMAYGIDGFAFASESLVGKYIGAQDEAKVRQAIWYSFAWSMGMAILISLVYWFFEIPLLRIFTDQEDIIQAALPYMIWIVLFPILSTPCFIWDGVFIGMTASKAMRNSMAISLLVYTGLFVWLQQYFGNHGLWIALLAFMVLRGVFQHWLFWKKGLALN